MDKRYGKALGTYLCWLLGGAANAAGGHDRDEGVRKHHK